MSESPTLAQKYFLAVARTLMRVATFETLPLREWFAG